MKMFSQKQEHIWLHGKISPNGMGIPKAILEFLERWDLE